MKINVTSDEKYTTNKFYYITIMKKKHKFVKQNEVKN